MEAPKTKREYFENGQIIVFKHGYWSKQMKHFNDACMSEVGYCQYSRWALQFKQILKNKKS